MSSPFTTSHSPSSSQSLQMEWPIPPLTPQPFSDYLYFSASASAPDSPPLSISSISRSQSNPSSPDAVHVSCNVPLVAPKPLPHHIPEFAGFEFGDNIDSGSSVSYRRYSLKRRRADEEERHQRISLPRSVLLAPWRSNQSDSKNGRPSRTRNRHRARS
ncbi:hypothetical protein C8R43DRAFT_139686 [Mycena crocata]|nr:hypothetical protein C8R43DRAFT_139686 [Mycena crocata]